MKSTEDQLKKFFGEISTTLGTVPVVKWTTYGRWTPDGLRVLNRFGETVYVHPEHKHVQRH